MALPCLGHRGTAWARLPTSLHPWAYTQRRAPRPALQFAPGKGPRTVTPFYIAGAFLVLAQILGIYGLITRKADLIFALIMVALVIAALVSGADGAYNQLR